MMAAATYGQGTFLFNTRDIPNNNNVQFTLDGQPATGSDVWVEVLAGTSASTLNPITPLIPLNRPVGSGAGYTSPFGMVMTVPGMAGGSSATIAYRAFKGANYAAALATSPQTLADATVTLAEGATPPAEVALGVRTIGIVTVPEPGTLALGLLGLGSLLVIRRRK